MPGTGQPLHWFWQLCHRICFLGSRNVKSYLGTIWEIMCSLGTRQPSLEQTSGERGCKMGTQTQQLVEHPEKGA